MIRKISDFEHMGLTPKQVVILDQQQAAHDEALLRRQEEARGANFRSRNLALADLTRMVGQANRLRGATFQYNSDPKTEIEGADSAAGRELVIRAAAFGIGERACGFCPLQKYCDLTREDLLTLVAKRTYDGHIIPEVTERRARLAKRVEAGAYAENNHLCATNASPSRLRKDTM